jgi:aryl-phospho-beta-D-glucosidase BglC (GH1 family)
MARKQKSSSLRQLIPVALLALLTACGGGGSDSSTASSSAPSAAAPGGREFAESAMNADPAAPARLTVDGSVLRGPDGGAVTLKGWNWGRWKTMQPQDASDNLQQGANSVRIPLRWFGLYSPSSVDSRLDSAPGYVNPANLQILDDMVQRASDAKLWIILFIDSDCGQDGTQSPEEIAYCDPTGQYPNGHNFWSDPELRARYVEVWKFIADRYKDVPYIGLFEPLPEPNPMGVSGADISAFYQEVMSGIESVVPNVPFLIGARNGYDMLKVAEAHIPSRHNVVYTGNLFVHPQGSASVTTAKLSNRLSKLTALRDTYNVPVHVQQVAAAPSVDPDNYWNATVLDMLNQAGVGFNFWEYRGSANTSEYGAYTKIPGGGWQPNQGVIDVVSEHLKN